MEYINLNGKMLRAGIFVKVKEDIWKDWLLRGGEAYIDSDEQLTPFAEQPIIGIGVGPLKGYVMLAFPTWWWKVEELDVVEPY